MRCMENKDVWKMKSLEDEGSGKSGLWKTMTVEYRDCGK